MEYGILESQETNGEESLVGQIIANKYKLVRALSEGGMGQIYLAEHTILNEPRAIKLLHPELLVHNKLRKRFINEFKVTHKISKKNPHIVQIHDDFAFEDGLGYYVMEYLEGRTLSEAIEDKPGALPIAWCIRVTSEICEGMTAVHEEGIIHRDLKPDNVFLIQHNAQSDYVKILDFGIAKQQKREGTRLTNTGGVLGTIPYMSPEQISGGTKLATGETIQMDGRSDMYALGCIVFEMLTGRPPFVINGPNTPLTRNTLLISHLQEAPPKLRSLRPDAPQALEDAVDRMLAKKPTERYPDMMALATALRAIPLDDKAHREPTTAANPKNPRQHTQMYGQGDATAHDIEQLIADELPATPNTPEPPQISVAPHTPQGIPTGDQATPGESSPEGSRSPIVLVAVIAVLLTVIGGLIWWIQQPKKPVDVVKRVPPRPRLPKHTKLQALFLAGQQAFMKKKYNKAAEAWRKAILMPGWKKSKYFPQLYLGVGNALSGAKLPHTARSYYRQYTKLAAADDPQKKQVTDVILPSLSKQINTNRARAKKALDALEQALKKDRFREAARLYQHAREQAPSIPSSQFRLAQMLAAKFPSLASQTQERMLRLLTPDEKLKSRAKLSLSQLKSLQDKRIATAKADANKAFALLKLGKIRQARTLLRKAIDPIQHMSIVQVHEHFKELGKKLFQERPKRVLLWLSLYAKKLAKFDKKGLRLWMGKDAKTLPTLKQTEAQRRATKWLTQANRAAQKALRADQKGRLQQAIAAYKRAAALLQKAIPLDVWELHKQLPNGLSLNQVTQQIALLNRLKALRAKALRLDASAKSEEAMVAYGAWLKALGNHPTSKRWKARVGNRKRAFASAAKLYRQGTYAYKKERWGTAIKHLGTYLKMFPKAHNKKPVTRMKKISECRIGTPWKLCKKLYK